LCEEIVSFASTRSSSSPSSSRSWLVRAPVPTSTQRQRGDRRRRVPRRRGAALCPGTTGIERARLDAASGARLV